jgi:hypothetical protein
VPPPRRRITASLCAVLAALLDGDLPVTRTAGDVATDANLSQTTAGDVLNRLVTDGHADTGLTPPGDRSRLTARPVRTYTLNTTGATYARAVLGLAGATVPGDPT